MWCSQRCRRAAYEERRAAACGPIATEVVVQRVEAPWDETIERVLESPVACRKVVRQLKRRLLDGDLQRPPWYTVLAELYELGEMNHASAGPGSTSKVDEVGLRGHFE